MRGFLKILLGVPQSPLEEEPEVTIETYKENAATVGELLQLPTCKHTVTQLRHIITVVIKGEGKKLSIYTFFLTYEDHFPGRGGTCIWSWISSL